ncbi:hypothetical protein [Nocardia miyunensis]|uniref:hypothetical protein n=1 Tax=Nocardia miyunensis TaxID=282684 RepID=UPI0012F51E0E|nr:hypothetical protein [Nocardia miyunensis]
MSVADSAHVEVRVEIATMTPNGFGDGKFRTVNENAAVLESEQSGFEEACPDAARIPFVLPRSG